jgi:excisionase family DNA binding protein
MNDETLLTVEEAAALLRIKPGTLYSWVSKGNVPHRRVGSLVRFDRDELMQWTIEKAHPEKQRRPRLSVVK